MTEDNTNPGRFADSSITRREFARLSAATGAALALPGNATADASSDAFTAEYQYVLNHTPDDHAVPTLVRFSDPTGPSAMEAAVDGEVITTTEPEPAAYSQLTASQAQTAADLPSASEFQFSPGSNPFWRIGYYPFGIFPEPRRSVDYTGFEQLKDGLAELETRYPDRIRVKNVGHSPGHHNNVTDRPDPKGMYVVELTNFDSDTAFEDKEKVFFSCSLHGLEMAGRETGARVLENVARGSEPDIQGNEAKIEPLLDDVVVMIGFVNPDGWAVRNPQYDSGWQVGGPDTRVPAAPLYERGNAEVNDTNRQYPIVGYINPGYYPAYSPPDSDDPNDVPSVIREKVPDALAFVEHFRTYENLNYGADLHGGPVFNEFVLGLISQDQFDTRELHELYEMCVVIDDVLEQALEVWTTAGDIRTSTPLGDDQYDPLLYGVLPEEAFDYATIYDTIGYTVSGAFLDWMAHPEPVGLDMTTLDFEMSFNHMTGGNVYNPELFEMEVKGYRTAIRTITSFAVRNSDTPHTDEEFSAHTETGGDDVAYVTTTAPHQVGDHDHDELARSDDQLEFEGTSVTTNASTITVDRGTTESTFDVEDADLHSMGVHLHAEESVFDLALVSPDDEVIREFEGVTEERVGGKCCGFPEFTVSEPAAGEWTLRIENLVGEPRTAEVRTWTMAAAANPDPREVDNWGGEGYEQREYQVTPFQFFEDYADFIGDDGSMEPVTIRQVANGALADYDHAVVIHDYGANADRVENGYDVTGEDGTTYVEALDAFVDGGGNLVVTDTGIHLLPQLDNELVDGSAIDSDGDLSRIHANVARFTSKNSDHPLLTDVREIQNQLWKVAPLGYQTSGEAPMDLVAESAFTDAGTGSAATSIAARRDGMVATGSFTEGPESGRGVHFISSLLPPASQQNLHPFGLLDYTVTFMGNLVLTSALGFQQVRETADATTTHGRGDEWQVEPPEAPGDPEFSVTGSRADDGSAFFAGQSNHVQVTVGTADFPDEVGDEAEVQITDQSPWNVYVGQLDAEGYGGNDDQEGNDQTVDLGTTTVGELRSGGLTREYIAEVPGTTGSYQFGPAAVELLDAADAVANEGNSDTFGGTDTNYVVGVDQSDADTATSDD